MADGLHLVHDTEKNNLNDDSSLACFATEFPQAVEISIIPSIEVEFVSPARVTGS